MADDKSLLEILAQVQVDKGDTANAMVMFLASRRVQDAIREFGGACQQAAKAMVDFINGQIVPGIADHYGVEKEALTMAMIDAFFAEVADEPIEVSSKTELTQPHRTE